MSRRSEAGFTLTELLVVIGILGVLVVLASQSFFYAKTEAAHATIQKWVKEAQTAAESALLDDQNLPAAVPLTSQNAAGPFSSALAQDFLPGISVPSSTRVDLFYNPNCPDFAIGCIESTIEARHCLGEEYAQWVRFSDGKFAYQDNVAGVGCS